MEILKALGGTFWITLALLFVALFMFNDTLRGGVDLASARMRYLYNRASTNLGLSSFNEDELNETEKARNIKKFRNARVGGLYNEGNTCFMNSVIQALASCDPISDYVDQFRDELTFSGGLGDVIQNLNQIHTRQHGYSTTRLVRLIGGGAQRWSRYNQEDAQEFFQELLTTLEADTKKKQASVGADPKTELSGEPQEPTNESQAQPVAEPQVEPEEKLSEEQKQEKALQRVTPFDGLFAVRVGCLACGDMEGIRKGVLSSVDLSLELNTTRISLDELLRNYTAMETISGVECYRCSLNAYRAELDKKVEEASAKNNSVLLNAFQKRIDEVASVMREKVIDDTVYKKLKGPAYKVQSDKTKQTMFARPTPDVLMIHINRSVFDLRTGIVKKNFASVDFPVELDLTPYVVDPADETNNDPRFSMHSTTSGEERDLYDLKAAVVHYGSANFGHYISFRKFHGFWWRISDDQVDLTTEAQVLTAQGVFMLFYERRGASVRPEFPTPDLNMLREDSEKFSDVEQTHDGDNHNVGEAEGEAEAEATEATEAPQEAEN